MSRHLPKTKRPSPHQPFRVAAIDPGFRRWGLALLRDGAHEATCTFADAYAVAHHLLLERRRQRLSGVFIERPPKGKLLSAVDVLLKALREENVPVVLVPCSQWKFSLLGNGRATKADIKAFAVQTFNLPDDLPQDSYDAALIAFYGWHSMRPYPVGHRGRRPSLRVSCDPPELWRKWPEMAQSLPSLYTQLLRQCSPNETPVGYQRIARRAAVSRDRKRFWAAVDALAVQGFLRREGNEITVLDPTHPSLLPVPVGPGAEEAIEGEFREVPIFLPPDELEVRLWRAYGEASATKGTSGSWVLYTQRDRDAIGTLARSPAGLVVRLYKELVRCFVFGGVLGGDGERDAVLESVEEAVTKWGATPYTLLRQWNKLMQLEAFRVHKRRTVEREQQEKEERCRIAELDQEHDLRATLATMLWWLSRYLPEDEGKAVPLLTVLRIGAEAGLPPSQLEEILEPWGGAQGIELVDAFTRDGTFERKVYQSDPERLLEAHHRAIQLEDENDPLVLEELEEAKAAYTETRRARRAERRMLPVPDPSRYGPLTISDFAHESGRGTEIPASRQRPVRWHDTEGRAHRSC